MPSKNQTNAHCVLGFKRGMPLMSIRMSECLLALRTGKIYREPILNYFTFLDMGNKFTWIGFGFKYNYRSFRKFVIEIRYILSSTIQILT